MIALETYGPVAALHHGRLWPGLRRPLMSVRCYAVDGLLIDTGLFAKRRAILAFARERGVLRCAVTHHHEDHSNNAVNLLGAGIAVHGAADTAARVGRGFVTYPYQRLVWGRARPAALAPLPDALETARHRFEVLAAPGHCDDQVVFYERSEGWLFSGDAFLGERIRLFRRDEDFERTVQTTRRLAELDFDALFCAHRPVPTGGRAAMRRKLQHLEDIGGEARRLHAQGLGVREIARRLLGGTPLTTWFLTLGDASAENLVRAILFGPRPRRG